MIVHGSPGPRGGDAASPGDRETGTGPPLRARSPSSAELGLLPGGGAGRRLGSARDLLGAVILIAAVWAGRARRLLARAAAAAAALVALAAAVDFAVEGSVPALLAAIANGLLVAFAPMVIAAAIVRNVREEGAVTLPTLSGVLSIYLLIGMFFSFLYAAIQAADDGGFFAQVSEPERSDFLYFSYITLSTTGYGDLTPAADLGRTLAVTEALFGQIYLVTIVALIVANLRPRR